MTWKTFSEIVTPIVAIFGAGLGVYNLIMDRLKSKQRLRVIPKAVVGTFPFQGSLQPGLLTTPNYFDAAKSENMIAIEIINIGNTNAVISLVGFLAKGTDRRIAIVNPILYDDLPWPRTLAPHETVTLYGNVTNLLKDPFAHAITAAFAETSIDILHKGKSKALKQFREYASSSRA